MKKYLATIFSSLIIIPSISNAIAPTNILHRNSSIFKNQFLKINNKDYINDDGSINWDKISNNMDNLVFNNKTLSSKFSTLTDKEKQDFNSKVQNFTDNFKAKNYSLEQAQDYIQTNVAHSDQFKDYYNNPGKAINNKNASLDQQIVGQFFAPKQKDDLKLTTTSTYQDVLNNLITQIKNSYSSQYSAGEIKITLADSSLATKKLYSDQNSLVNIVNNNFSVNFNLTVDNNTIKNETLNLTNIGASGKDLYNAVLTYLSADNPQQLILTDGFYSSGNDYVNALITKINQRFANFTNTIQLTATGDGANQEGYIVDSKEWTNNFLNEKFMIPLNVSDTSDNLNQQANLYIKDPNWPKVDGFGVLHNYMLFSLFKNPPTECGNQDLGLNTSNTYQDALNKLLDRTKRIFDGYDFKLQLSDSSLANRQLSKDLNPTHPNDFSFNVSFTSFTGEVEQGTVHLTNIALDPQDQKTMNAYHNLQDTINKLNIANTSLSILSTVFAIAAAAFWAASWWFGVSVPWAVACTAAAAITGAIAGVIGLCEYIKDVNSASYWSRVELSVTSVYALGQLIYGTIGAVLLGSEAALTVTEWALPAIAAAVSLILTIYSIISTWG